MEIFEIPAKKLDRKSIGILEHSQRGIPVQIFGKCRLESGRTSGRNSGSNTTKNAERILWDILEGITSGISREVTKRNPNGFSEKDYCGGIFGWFSRCGVYFCSEKILQMIKFGTCMTCEIKYFSACEMNLALPQWFHLIVSFPLSSNE